ncbi:hypothetical protein WH47_11909 [Habropoda laboriosa]|uniref:Uncharacterized protein n=1 Tax=Habropoda laboriosa TaxID=597456 RepID=A0A0L7R7K7_9HYME|nr:hypothetical protein WH47_11909 [Habropoda laboriosa]
MADGPSAEDAATDLGDSDSRLTRDRHKRQDAASSITSLSTGQDIARRVHEDATVLESHPQQHHRQQHRPLRRNCHTHPHPSRRHPGSNANGNNNNSNGNINNNNHHHNHHYHRREHEDNEAVDGNERVSKNESGSGISVDTTCVVPFTSPTSDDYDEYDDDEEEEDEEDEEEETDTVNAGKKKGVSKKCRGGVVRIDVVTKTVKKKEESNSVNSNSNGNGSSNNNNGTSGGEGGVMTGHATRGGDNAASSVGDGRRSRSAAVDAAFLDASAPNDRVTTTSSEMSECRRLNRGNVNDNVHKHQEGDGDEDEEQALEKPNSRLGCDTSRETSREDEDAVRKTDGIASDGSSSSDGGSGVGAAAAVSASGGAGAAGVTANGLVAGRHQGSPFKGQVRTAEDTLVGPCGKKRCADRYDSSESSDR